MLSFEKQIKRNSKIVRPSNQAKIAMIISYRNVLYDFKTVEEKEEEERQFTGTIYYNIILKKMSKIRHS